jgi:hypothetical protein
MKDLKINTEINFLSVKVRLDPAQVNLASVRKNNKFLLQQIFDECEKDTKKLYDLFNPEMKYPKYTSQSRSKYCVGFLCKYLDTYVFRIFSRNDVYQRRVRTGTTVIESDTTEILRIIRTEDGEFSFSKNLAYSLGNFNNTIAYKKWHLSDMVYGVFLNKVIKQCECGYLNDYISQENVECSHYVKLLFKALYNNKAEIVFKHKLFSSTYRISNLTDYLAEFTPKQIDFACKNDVVNALPVIKNYSLLDVDILRGMEGIMRRRSWWRDSIYDNLINSFNELNFSCDDLYKRLIGFLRKVDYFDPSLYKDYIEMLRYRQGITIKDFFDKNYVERHDRMLLEKRREAKEEMGKEYKKVAKELSWIDREENGFFVILPKTIYDFEGEGEMQHNCVFHCEYYKRVINHQSIVVFLRKEKDKSFVTIEFEYGTFEVLQALEKYNKKTKEEVYKYVVDLGKRLQGEMLSHQ